MIYYTEKLAIQCGQWNIVKRNAGLLSDAVRLDIVINVILTWRKLSFLIGQCEVNALYFKMTTTQLKMKKWLKKITSYGERTQKPRHLYTS